MAKGPTVNKLSVIVRTKTGKGASRQARREGLVPVVLYGHGSDPQHLELNARDFAAEIVSILKDGVAAPVAAVAVA